MPEKKAEEAPKMEANPSKGSGNGSKIIIIVVALAVFGLIVLGIGGVVAYKVFFSVPSSEAVCEKVQDLLNEEYSKTIGDGEEKLFDDEFMNECIEDEKKSREDLSKSEIKEYTKCIMDADTFDDLEKCDAWDE